MKHVSVNRIAQRSTALLSELHANQRDVSWAFPSHKNVFTVSVFFKRISEFNWFWFLVNVRLYITRHDLVWVSVRDDNRREKNYPKKNRRQNIVVVDDVTLRYFRLVTIEGRQSFFHIVCLHFFLSFEFIKAADEVIVARLPNECNFFHSNWLSKNIIDSLNAVANNTCHWFRMKEVNQINSKANQHPTDSVFPYAMCGMFHLTIRVTFLQNPIYYPIHLIKLWLVYRREHN